MMLQSIRFVVNVVSVFYFSLSICVDAASDSNSQKSIQSKAGYSKGDTVPVTCLNRTIETGEHIADADGNLQYIPFLECNETKSQLAFSYETPETVTCTVDSLSDEFYHLIEYFVHSDVPLSCRVPSYPLSSDDALQGSGLPHENVATEAERWTPFTIALQGSLQRSHLHLHTTINTLFHTSRDPATSKSRDQTSRLIASTAYSIPDVASAIYSEGTKVIRNDPLIFTFNVGWVDGSVLPGMVGRPVLGVKDHSVGFSLLSFFAVAGSAGVGALGMLVYERRKSGRGLHANGLLGGNVGNGMAARTTGYGGYGGYGGYNSNMGKRD